MDRATPLHLYAIGLGSNRRHGRFGEPRHILVAALEALESADCEPVDASPIIDSAPLGPSRRRFANAAVLVATPLDPPDMLDLLKGVEARFGARRGQRWAARTLDLDILLWSGGGWSDDRLTVPHPAMIERGFVLAPLVRIAPRWRHPLTGHTVRQLFARYNRRKPVDRARLAD